jgi:hypothetical protein
MRAVSLSGASLAFRLTVVPWAAQQTVERGDLPEGFAALDSWAGSLYAVHMVSATSPSRSSGGRALGR